MDYKDIKGSYLTDNEADFLKKHTKNKLCIEIGSYIGKSTVCIADNAKKIFTIDNFMFGGFDEFDKNTKEYNNIRLIQSSSNVAYRMFPKEYADFIFVDGSHIYEMIKIDINNFFPILKKGGIIAFHDYNFGFFTEKDNYESISKAVNEIFPKLDGHCDSIAWKVKRK